MNEYMTELLKNNKQCHSTWEAYIIALRGTGSGIVSGVDVKKLPVSNQWLQQASSKQWYL